MDAFVILNLQIQKWRRKEIKQFTLGLKGRKKDGAWIINPGRLWNPYLNCYVSIYLWGVGGAGFQLCDHMSFTKVVIEIPTLTAHVM